MVDVITIGQLARYAQVSTKTIRVYHEKGLLREPARDASGYRRYTADDAIELIKIRTLAECGIPLARIRELRAAPEQDFAAAVQQVDGDLSARIEALVATRQRLRQLADGHVHRLPLEVTRHLDGLTALGFTARWVTLETNLWILVFATHPEAAIDLFRDQAQALADADLRAIYLDYDRAHDLDPADLALATLARRIATATRRRYGSGDLPGQHTGSEVPTLIQGSVNATSPAWRRLDQLIREQLGV